MKSSVLVKDQKKTFTAAWEEGTDWITLIATVRYDDQCENGHNTFAITGDTHRNGKEDYGGCIHEIIAERIPHLAPYIKWHHCTTDGPWGYLENTIYHAGDRDCWGLRKGEFRQHTSRGKQNEGVSGVPNWHLELPKTNDVYSIEKPAPVTLEWQPYGRTGEGKERDLAAARNSAIWPEATDEQLCLEPEELKKLLEARLPKLMEDFQAAVESLGLVY